MGMPNIPRVYDRNMNRLAYLQNATEITYKKPLNELWTAGFSLPTDDPKNVYCKGLNFVELFDGERRVDLFRITGQDMERSDSSTAVYTCEHVLATLIDDVLFQYHQIGGATVQTTQVLQYILGKQASARWVLGGCEFDRQFEYNFENENLLSAIFAVPECFDQNYRWEWDTTVRPWQLFLRKASTTLKSEIRYKKNMTDIKRSIDYTQLVTRLYALGYGEGDNQLNIKAVNNNLPYIEDASAQQEYGVVQSILTDSRFEYPETLKAYAETLLSQYKEPYITYTAEAVDLYRMSGDDFSRFEPGDAIRVIDTVDNIVVNTRIVSVEKGDLRGDPAAISVTLANKDQDIASSISDLQNRSIISETYAQGATNLQTQNFADNADESHPATFRVYIPAETARINKIKLSVSLEPFRGYTKSLAAAEQTNSSTSSGGGSQTTTEAGGGQSETSSATALESSNVLPSQTDGQAVHNHGIPADAKIAFTEDGETISGWHYWYPSGAHTHPAHTHRVQISAHSHEVDIPNHSHTFKIPAHTHEITFGIYEGDTADAVTIKVDGTTIPAPTDLENIDIVAYFSTDDAGKITRDAWHTIEIVPDKMTRVAASLFTQLFCNSRGSGDY